MIENPEAVDAAIAFVAAADRLPRPPEVDTETELRVFFASLPAADAPRRSPRLSRAVRLGAAGFAAVAATIVAVNLLSGEASTGTSGFVSQARAAEIVHLIKRALISYPPGQVLEVLTDSHEVSPTKSVWSKYNMWQSTTAPYIERQQSIGGEVPSSEEGFSSTGIPQVYDPANNTIYEPRSAYVLSNGPRSGTRTLTVPKAEPWAYGITVPVRYRGTARLVITDVQARGLQDGSDELIYGSALLTKRRGFYNTHRFYILIRPTVTAASNSNPATLQDWAQRLESRGTRVKLDGGSAVEITQDHQTVWFSLKDMRPIKSFVRTTVATNGSPSRGYDDLTTFYRAFRVVKGAGGQRLLSIQDAHPNAKIVVGQIRYMVNAQRLQ
jgi:hypothetical protein